MKSRKPKKWVSKTSNSKLLFELLDDDVSVVQLLNDKYYPADPNYKVKEGWWNGWTPLAYAVYKKRPGLVRYLLSKGANADQLLPGTPYTLLKYSLVYPDISYFPYKDVSKAEMDPVTFELVWHILRNGSALSVPLDSELVLDTLMYQAIERDTIDLKLIQSLVAIPILSLPLFFQSLQRNYEIGNSGGNENKESIVRYFTPGLFLLVKKYSHSHWIISRSIIESIKDIPHKTPDTNELVVGIALRNLDWEIADALIGRGTEIPKEMLDFEPYCAVPSKYTLVSSKVRARYSPLVWIVKHTRREDFLWESSPFHQNPINCLLGILKRGFNIDEPFQHEEQTWTSLSWAVFRNNIILTRILLRHGADPNQNMPGTDLPCLHYAASMGFSEITAEFLDTGKVLIESLSNRQKTALDYAIMDKQITTIGLLLSRGAIIQSLYHWSLYYFLITKYDPRDPRDSDVLIALDALVTQLTHLRDTRQLDAMFNRILNEISRYLDDLKKLTSRCGNETFQVIDEATGMQLPREMIHTITAYGGPLQHFGMFRLVDVKKVLTNGFAIPDNTGCMVM